VSVLVCLLGSTTVLRGDWFQTERSYCAVSGSHCRCAFFNLTVSYTMFIPCLCCAAALPGGWCRVQVMYVPVYFGIRYAHTAPLGPSQFDLNCVICMLTFCHSSAQNKLLFPTRCTRSHHTPPTLREHSFLLSTTHFPPCLQPFMLHRCIVSEFGFQPIPQSPLGPLPPPG
jgi:hypothetical protein